MGFEIMWVNYKIRNFFVFLFIHYGGHKVFLLLLFLRALCAFVFLFIPF